MSCNNGIPERVKNRRYVPVDADLCRWEEVEPMVMELLGREIRSGADLERFIFDSSEFEAAIQEEAARSQLAISVDTADEAARERFNHLQENVFSRLSPLTDQLDKKLLESPYLDALDPVEYGQLKKVTENSKRLFREENVPLGVEDAKLIESYNGIAGGMSVEFDGKRLNLTQVAEKLKETDRGLRERAWRAIAACKAEYREKLDDVYDNMIRVRHQMALNAGFANFRDFRHAIYNRFDYTPQDCILFHETVEKVVVPALMKRRDRRKANMKLDVLRPWDMRVDELGRAPLRPFKDAKALIDACGAVLDRIYPDLGDDLRLLESYGNLDLDTRQNKAPVGFNMPLAETGVSFVFMNSMGTHYDFLVLLHESGHAIETRACSANPVQLYRNTPQEWGECASQAMELLGLDHLDVLYADEDTRNRCFSEKMEEILLSLVTTARIDAFQHWVYTNPEHTHAERNEKWLELSRRFPDGSDTSGLEPFLEISWQGIPHIFIVPFYYIEYGIAQIAAVQVYYRSRTAGQETVKQWLDTMKLGYSRSIPELYEAAGLKFIFHGEYMGRLVRFIEGELDRIEG